MKDVNILVRKVSFPAKHGFIVKDTKGTKARGQRRMQYAICSIQYAVRIMKYAICNMQYAVCNMRGRRLEVGGWMLGVGGWRLSVGGPQKRPPMRRLSAK